MYYSLTKKKDLSTYLCKICRGIYNNPVLDPNKISDDRYNSLVKLMLKETKKNESSTKPIKLKDKKQNELINDLHN